MTIDYKIKDAKPCDINRDTVKISALSSWKIDQYEYFTGEAILPSDQSRIMEQATFTYSLLGKALRKQIKMIEDQGEKQIKTHEEHGKQLLKSSDKKEFLTDSKQKEIFEELASNSMKEIWDLHKQTDFNDLTYKYKSKTIL